MITRQDMLEDYDWRCAFYEAYHHAYAGYGDDTVDGHPIEKVTEVHYAVAGENDEDDWLAIVGWSGEEGPFAVMSAGCDYTGWD